MPRGQKKVLYTLKLKLQAVVRCLKWVLKTKPMSFESSKSSLPWNHLFRSHTQPFFFFFFKNRAVSSHTQLFKHRFWISISGLHDCL